MGSSGIQKYGVGDMLSVKGLGSAKLFLMACSQAYYMAYSKHGNTLYESGKFRARITVTVLLNYRVDCS